METKTTTDQPTAAAMPPSSNSSSIGKNSDVSLTGGGGGGDEDEVQSEYKGGPLDCLNALEQVLPFKKSISNYYSGKSKSFTSLSNAASCRSIEEIRKPEDAYTRKRKNLLAFATFWDKSQGNDSSGGSSHGISKRTAYSKSMVSLATPTNSVESTSGEHSNSSSSSPGCCLPPLPPQTRMTSRNEESMNISKE